MLQLYEMKKLLNIICAALLVAGLCGCEKLKDQIPEVDFENLPGTWVKEWPEGVQDAGEVTWTFSFGENGNFQDDVLSIHVYDVFTGNNDAEYVFQTQHVNQPLGIGTPITTLEVFRRDRYTGDEELYFKPLAEYDVTECSSNKLVLKRTSVDVDGWNPFEEEIMLRKRK